MFLITQKQTLQVTAAEAGTSATLLGGGYGNNWLSKLEDPVTETNIVNLIVTNNKNVTIDSTTYDVTTQFTKGANVSENGTDDLYYYYKTNAKDNTLYDVVIYADVDVIKAPTDSVYLFGIYEYNSGYVSKLKTIIFENFDTSNVIYMNSMFNGCSSLTSLGLSSFDTSNVTTMESMFSNCSSLTSLDLSSFNTSNVTDMSGMFGCCCELTELNLNNFDTSNVLRYDGMFNSCSVLEYLFISNFDLTEAINVDNMFGYCNNLKQINAPKTMGKTVVDLSVAGVELYVNGTGDIVSEISSENEGTILTLRNTAPVEPTPEPDPDTPGTGIDLLDMVILSGLTMLITAVAVAIILNEKKKKLVSKVNLNHINKFTK